MNKTEFIELMVKAKIELHDTENRWGLCTVFRRITDKCYLAFNLKNMLGDFYIDIDSRAAYYWGRKHNDTIYYYNEIPGTEEDKNARFIGLCLFEEYVLDEELYKEL